MSPKEIFLVRHGRTEWNRDKRYQGQKDSPLLKESLEQLSNTGKELASLSFDHVFCSPLGRTRETLRLLNHQGSAASYTDALKEINLGEMEGVAWENPPSELKEPSRIFWNSPEDFQAPGGENFTDVRTRVEDFLNTELKDLRGKILLVTHTVVIKSFLSLAENRPVSRIWSDPHIPPGSISRCTWDSKGLKWASPSPA